VGYNAGNADNYGTIKYSYSTVTVYGTSDVGGLVGENVGSKGEIDYSYSMGSVLVPALR